VATRDLAHNILPTCPIKPAATTSTVAAATGNSTDTQGYEGVTAIVNLGTWTDGTFTPALYESDDNATFTAVAATDLIGAFTAISSNANVNKCQWVGYKGGKRYIAVNIAVASATTGMIIGTTVVLSHARHNPTF
jgi:hypothetical protein